MGVVFTACVVCCLVAAHTGMDLKAPQSPAATRRRQRSHLCCYNYLDRRLLGGKASVPT